MHYVRSKKFSGSRMNAVQGAEMSTKDHNKTVAGIHFGVGTFLAFWLFASPWIIAQSVRRAEQTPQAILIFGIVAAIAALMLSTAIAMDRKKRIGAKT